MGWRISTDLRAAIIAEAAAAPAVEVCGLLLGAGEVIATALPCRNVADDPSCRFEIDPAALFAAHRRARAGGAAVLGCYHSHPGGRAEPSPRDADGAAPNGWLWIVVAGGTVTGWQAVEAGPWHGRFAPVPLLPIDQRGHGGPPIAGPTSVDKDGG